MRHQSRMHRDSGAEIVEWGAALLMLATLVAVLVGPTLPQSVQDNISYAICRVFNGAADCESPADKAFKPQACVTNISVNSVGGKVSVAIFDVGKDVTFIRVTDSTGKVTVTAVNGTSAGVGTGIGAGVNFGNTLNIGADADIHGGIKVGIGDSWEFGSQEEADRFIGEIQKQTTQEAVKSSGPLGFVGGSIWGAVDSPDVRESDIERYEVELGGDAGVSTGFGFGPANPKGSRRDNRTDGDQPGADISPNLNAYARVEANQKAIVENNKKTGEKSVTVSVSGGANAGANYVVDGVQARGKVTGTVKLTYDKDGNLNKLTLTRNAIVNNESEITTTELPITTDEERAAVYQNLLGDQAALSAGQVPIAGTPLRLTFDDMTPDTAPGPNATPLQQLLYDKGKTSRVTYDYDANNRSYGANVKFGLKLGLGVDINDSTANANSGQFLGAPGPNGREWKNFKECNS